MSKRPTAIFVCGFSGVGKSFFARRISMISNTPVIGKHELAEETVQKMNELLGNDPGERKNDKYLKFVRPFEYEVLTNAAFCKLERGSDVILDAPFITEVAFPNWVTNTRKQLDAMGYDTIFVWMEAGTEEIHRRLEERHSARDAKKLLNWEAHIEEVKNFNAPYADFDFVVKSSNHDDELRKILIQLEQSA